MIRLIDERVMEKLRDKPENIDSEEFMPLVGEWREEKVSKAKCPYCVKPIEKQATKCNHCLSELEWFKFDGLYGPCKAGASEEMEAALLLARARNTLHATTKAAKKAKIEEIEKIGRIEEIEEIQKIEKIERSEESRIEEIWKLLAKSGHHKCFGCGGPSVTRSEIEKIVRDPRLSALSLLGELNRRNHRCSSCDYDEKNPSWGKFSAEMILTYAFYTFLFWLIFWLANR